MSTGEMFQRRTESESESDGPRSLIEATYEQLSLDIIHGKYGPGDKLRLQPLSENYGVSVGTVRESLSLLVSDGLVLTQSQKGFRVAPMSLVDFEDLTKARVLLEASALRDSIVSGKDDWEGRVVQAYHRLSLAEKRLEANPIAGFEIWEQRNQEFHDALVSASSSRWVQKFRVILYKQAERYRRLSTASRVSPGVLAHAEHEKIFELAIARDADAAVEALSIHIWSAVEFLKGSGLILESPDKEG